MKKFQFLLMMLAGFVVNAQVKGTISYQGYLTDPVSGDPVTNGDYNITFKFYDDTNVVVETRGPIVATVVNGLFTVLIGGGTAAPNLPLPVNIWDKNYTVGITVGEGSELTPRVPLTSVPYAFQAEVANQVDGANIVGNISAIQLSGTIDNARLDPELQDLADGELSGNLVGTGINATNITTGTLSGALLDGVDAGKLTGTVDNARLDADLQDLADGSLSGSKEIGRAHV